MNFRSQFSTDAARYLTPPPRPASAAVTSPNESAAPTFSPPAPFSNKSMTAVVLGAGIGFGGAILLVVVGSFVIWYMRRMRTFAGSCEAPLHHPKEDHFSNPNQHWQQNTATKAYNTVGLPPKSICSPRAPSYKNNSSSSVSTPLKGSRTSSLGSEKIFTHFLSGHLVGIPKRTFTYEELAFATDGFCSSNLLGEGGFGYVHKGVLSDGKEIAVKQLKTGSRQGEREFQSEVGTISCIHHKHLVSLVGYCSSGDRRVLVYDFVPNKTLDFHLHGKRGEAPPSNWVPLNWETRMKIALGSAKGLAYLHEDCQPKIIHRDIKAANILLDNSFEAKVSDFGLARCTLDSDTHVSTRVIGTFGYIAPEYAQTGKLTVRSDVFSFGVMLLELITGRRPIDKDEGQFCKEDNIVDWARPLLTQAMEDSNFDALVDARLAKDYDFTEMSRMVTCAAACVRHLARLRPRMSQIVQALEGKMPLHVLKERETVSGGSPESSEFESIISMHDTMKFRKLIFDNLELDSSECSGQNSECLRVNPNLDSSNEGRITETNQNEGSKDGSNHSGL